MRAVLRIAACELQRLSFSIVSISSFQSTFRCRLHQDVETRISRGVWKYPSTYRVDLAPQPLCKGGRRFGPRGREIADDGVGAGAF